MALNVQDIDKHAGPKAGTLVSSPSTESLDITDKEAFLSSFTPEEDKAIRRKVDLRFLLLIGLMYLVKNVSCGNACY